LRNALPQRASHPPTPAARGSPPITIAPRVAQECVLAALCGRGASSCLCAATGARRVRLAAARCLGEAQQAREVAARRHGGPCWRRSPGREPDVAPTHVSAKPWRSEDRAGFGRRWRARARAPAHCSLWRTRSSAPRALAWWRQMGVARGACRTCAVSEVEQRQVVGHGAVRPRAEAPAEERARAVRFVSHADHRRPAYTRQPRGARRRPCRSAHAPPPTGRDVEFGRWIGARWARPGRVRGPCVRARRGRFEGDDCLLRRDLRDG
jgi:hypothetical protein